MLIGKVLMKEKLEMKVCNMCFKMLSEHLLAGTEVCVDVWYVWPSADRASGSCTVGFLQICCVLHRKIPSLTCGTWLFTWHHICAEAVFPHCIKLVLNAVCQTYICVISFELAVNCTHKIVGVLSLNFEPSFTAVWSCITAMSYLLVRVHLVVWLRCNLEESHMKKFAKITPIIVIVNVK
jgi:hypothetical protein